MIARSDSSVRRPRYAIATIVLAVLLGQMVVFGNAMTALLVPSVLGVLLLAALVRWLSPAGDPVAYQRLLRWTMVSFGLHLVIGLVITNGGPVIESLLAAPDAQTYDKFARELVGNWTSGLPAPDLPDGKQGFYYLLAGLYWVFGAEPFAALAVNATMAAALVPLLSDSTHRLFGPSAARSAAPLVVLLPGILLWPSLPIKEAAVLFFVAAAMNCAVRVTERATLGALAGMATSIALLFSFRAWVALVLAAGLVAGIALGKGGVTGIGSGLGGASIVALLIALGLGYSGYQVAVSADLTKADVVRQGLAVEAGSGFDADVDISTPQGALSYLPQGLVQFALGPFPWQIRGVRQLVVVPEVIVWWALLPSLWVGFREGRRLARRRVLVLILPAVLTGILLALSVGNFGTVVRERVQFVIPLVPIIALGLSERAARRAPAEDPRVLAHTATDRAAT